MDCNVLLKFIFWVAGQPTISSVTNTRGFCGRSPLVFGWGSGSQTKCYLLNNNFHGISVLFIGTVQKSNFMPSQPENIAVVMKNF